VAKWKPRHPAKWITASVTCRLGQRYPSADRARSQLTCTLGALTVNLKIVSCSQCQGGYHIVTRNELFQHRNVLTEVPRG
jgi:hypothetical protein